MHLSHTVMCESKAVGSLVYLLHSGRSRSNDADFYPPPTPWPLGTVGYQRSMGLVRLGPDMTIGTLQMAAYYNNAHDACMFF